MKKILLSITLALVMVLSLASIALADDPTETTITWSGSGVVTGGVTAGDDANTSFSTAGEGISGTFYAKDFNYNHYGYNVDSFNTNVNASLFSATSLATFSYTTVRTDSYVPKYGIPGQVSTSILQILDGFGSIATGSQSNYADMKDSTYNQQLPGGHNIVANATWYGMERRVVASDGDSAFVSAFGNGLATLDCMSSEMYAGRVRLGRGCGCFTDANFSATGIGGTFTASGTGGTGVSFDGMGISSGGGTLSFIANWLNSVSVADYSVTAQ